MKEYKVRATYTLDIELEVFANSEEEAISKLIKKDVKDVIEDCTILGADSENETAEISYGTFKVRASNIDYDISYSDVWDIVAEENPSISQGSEEFENLVQMKLDVIKFNLPKTLEFSITDDKKYLEDDVADKVSDITGWSVNSCDYEIIEVE